MALYFDDRPILKVTKRGYIAVFDYCDCGSRTYAWLNEQVNIFYKKMRWIQCGGCDKSHDINDFRIEKC